VNRGLRTADYRKTPCGVTTNESGSAEQSQPREAVRARAGRTNKAKLAIADFDFGLRIEATGVRNKAKLAIADWGFRIAD